MIKLEIKYSVEYEVQRVLESIKKLQFYRDNKYNVRFPEKLVINPSIEIPNISEKQINDVVEAEYSESDYEVQKTFLLENWQKLIDEISTEFTKTSLNPREKYTINLTKYGVGGSYHFPDIIVANIKNSYSFGLLRTTLHEILHLIIHQWIDKYKVNHWQKERIVDLLMIRLTPKLNKPQQIPIDIGDIDRIFNDNYPNIEMIIKNAGLLNLN